MQEILNLIDCLLLFVATIANPVQLFNLGLDIFDFPSLSCHLCSHFFLFLLCSIAFEVICSSVVSRPSSNQDIIQLNGKSQTLQSPSGLATYLDFPM